MYTFPHLIILILFWSNLSHSQNKVEHSPNGWIKHTYGMVQSVPIPDSTRPLFPKSGVLRIQQITNTLLYYIRTVDSIIFIKFWIMCVQQTERIELANNIIIKLCNSRYTYLNSSINYYTSTYMSALVYRTYHFTKLTVV